MKVAKEEVIGLLTAIQIFVEEDEDDENFRYQVMMRRVVDALIEVPGIQVSVEHDEYDYLIPSALIQFGRDWKGPDRDQVLAEMASGERPIYLDDLGNPDEFVVSPLSLDDEELETVIQRLREVLLKP